MDTKVKSWITQIKNDGELVRILDSATYNEMIDKRINSLVNAAQRYQYNQLSEATTRRVAELAEVELIASLYMPHDKQYRIIRANRVYITEYITYEAAREYITDMALHIFNGRPKLESIYTIVNPLINIYNGKPVLKFTSRSHRYWRIERCIQ